MGAKTATEIHIHRPRALVAAECFLHIHNKIWWYVLMIYGNSRRTLADRLKAALLEHPADAKFADDLATTHADLRSACDDEVCGPSDGTISRLHSGATSAKIAP
ncbi:MAG: hypothetical protein ACRDRJ_24200 [Streptosporangiaceae bacterium]